MRSSCLRRAAAYVFVAAAFAPRLAFGWDALGHALVAELAERQLSPEAQAQIAQLLPDEAEPRLGSIASWADEVRKEEPAYSHTGPLHYVNFKGECRSNPPQDCPDGQCAIGAITRYAAILGDESQPQAARAEALKFVVHVVGDLHQPLHAGHRNDRGGNQFQVNYRGKGSNLHRVWDHDVLATTRLSRPKYIERLSQEPLPPPGTLDPVQWAIASCKLTDAEGFYPAKPGKLAEDYPANQRPLVEAQIRLAAARLAAILERELGTGKTARAAK